MEIICWGSFPTKKRTNNRSFWSIVSNKSDKKTHSILFICLKCDSRDNRNKTQKIETCFYFMFLFVKSDCVIESRFASVLFKLFSELLYKLRVEWNEWNQQSRKKYKLKYHTAYVVYSIWFRNPFLRLWNAIGERLVKVRR